MTRVTQAGIDQPRGTLRERLQASAEFCFYAAENLYDSLDETDSKTWTKAQNEAEDITNDLSVLGTMVMGAMGRIQAPAGLCRHRLVAKGVGMCRACGVAFLLYNRR